MNNKKYSQICIFQIEVLQNLTSGRGSLKEPIKHGKSERIRIGNTGWSQENSAQKHTHASGLLKTQAPLNPLVYTIPDKPREGQGQTEDKMDGLKLPQILRNEKTLIWGGN